VCCIQWEMGKIFKDVAVNGIKSSVCVCVWGGVLLCILIVFKSG